MALYDTAENIVNDAAVEAGLDSSSDVFGSTDPSFIRLRALLKSAGRGLVLQNAWLQCVKEHTFTTNGSSSYNLPADFQSMVDQTSWNRTSVMPLVPVGAEAWQYLQAQPTGSPWTALFRPRDTTVEIFPSTSTGEEVAFEYRSRYWAAPTGQAAPTTDAATANTDTVFLDAQLMTRALKLAYLRAVGQDTAAAQMEFNQVFEDVRNANIGSAPMLSLVPRPIDPVAGANGFAVGATGFGFNGEGGLY